MGGVQARTRYRTEGEAAFEAHYWRPLSEQLTAEGTDTIAWHLEHHHHLQVSTATIHRYRHRAGLVTPAPRSVPSPGVERVRS